MVSSNINGLLFRIVLFWDAFKGQTNHDRPAFMWISCRVYHACELLITNDAMVLAFVQEKLTFGIK